MNTIIDSLNKIKNSPGIPESKSQNKGAPAGIFFAVV